MQVTDDNSEEYQKIKTSFIDAIKIADELFASGKIRRAYYHYQHIIYDSHRRNSKLHNNDKICVKAICYYGEYKCDSTRTHKLKRAFELSGKIHYYIILYQSLIDLLDLIIKSDDLYFIKHLIRCIILTINSKKPEPELFIPLVHQKIKYTLMKLKNLFKPIGNDVDILICYYQLYSWLRPNIDSSDAISIDNDYLVKTCPDVYTIEEYDELKSYYNLSTKCIPNYRSDTFYKMI